LQGVKRAGSEIYHSPPSSEVVKNAWGYTSTCPYVQFFVVVLHEAELTLPFTLPSFSAILTNNVYYFMETGETTWIYCRPIV
jgi:hypothetical protein